MKTCRNFNGTFISLVGEHDNQILTWQAAGIQAKEILDRWWYKWRHKSWMPTYKLFVTRPSGRDLNKIRHLVEDRVMTAYIDKVFPLSQVREALAYSMDGHA